MAHKWPRCLRFPENILLGYTTTETLAGAINATLTETALVAQPEEAKAQASVRIENALLPVRTHTHNQRERETERDRERQRERERERERERYSVGLLILPPILAQPSNHEALFRRPR